MTWFSKLTNTSMRLAGDHPRQQQTESGRGGPVRVGGDTHLAAGMPVLAPTHACAKKGGSYSAYSLV